MLLESEAWKHFTKKKKLKHAAKSHENSFICFSLGLKICVWAQQWVPEGAWVTGVSAWKIFCATVGVTPLPMQLTTRILGHSSVPTYLPYSRVPKPPQSLTVPHQVLAHPPSCSLSCLCAIHAGGSGLLAAPAQSR